jgi:hypothetical protein
MPGKLIQVATETVSSNVSEVDLIGTTTDDVYMVTISAMSCTSGSQTMNYRVLSSSAPDTTSNYDRAHNNFRTDTTFSNSAAQNETSSRIFSSPDINEIGSNALLYLYNFNNASQHSFITFYTANKHNSNIVLSQQGGLIHTVNQANNGIRFFMSGGSISSGTFTLYKVV